MFAIFCFIRRFKKSTSQNENLENEMIETGWPGYNEYYSSQGFANTSLTNENYRSDSEHELMTE